MHKQQEAFLKPLFALIFILSLFFVSGLWAEAAKDIDLDEEYLQRLERELTAEEKFLENIIGELISKGDREFIETLIYRMGYEKAQEKLPRFFFMSQFGGGPLSSGGVGLHIYNRQFYTYLAGGYTHYGKYKDYSFSFINEVKLFDVYVYKRDRFDFLLGGNISYFSEPGSFISSITLKTIYSMPDLFFAPYLVCNFYFDKNKGQNRLIYQIGVGFNFYPWG